MLGTCDCADVRAGGLKSVRHKSANPLSGVIGNARARRDRVQGWARSLHAIAARSARAEREDWIITSSARFSEVM